MATMQMHSMTETGTLRSFVHAITTTVCIPPTLCYTVMNLDLLLQTEQTQKDVATLTKEVRAMQKNGASRSHSTMGEGSTALFISAIMHCTSTDGASPCTLLLHNGIPTVVVALRRLSMHMRHWRDITMTTAERCDVGMAIRQSGEMPGTSACATSKLTSPHAEHLQTTGATPSFCGNTNEEIWEAIGGKHMERASTTRKSTALVGLPMSELQNMLQKASTDKNKTLAFDTNNRFAGIDFSNKSLMVPRPSCKVTGKPTLATPLVRTHWPLPLERAPSADLMDQFLEMAAMFVHNEAFVPPVKGATLLTRIGH
jgi:hypothetical protein